MLRIFPTFPHSLFHPQIAGVAILGVGIWVKVDSGSILNFLGKIENVPKEISQVLNVGYLLIAIGAILLIIGFLGCGGAIRESKCMLLLVGFQFYREQKMKFNVMPFLGASLNIKIHTTHICMLHAKLLSAAY